MLTTGATGKDISDLGDLHMHLEFSLSHPRFDASTTPCLRVGAAMN